MHFWTTVRGLCLQKLGYVLKTTKFGSLFAICVTSIRTVKQSIVQYFVFIHAKGDKFVFKSTLPDEFGIVSSINFLFSSVFFSSRYQKSSIRIHNGELFLQGSSWHVLTGRDCHRKVVIRGWHFEILSHVC